MAACRHFVAFNNGVGLYVILHRAVALYVLCSLLWLKNVHATVARLQAAVLWLQIWSTTVYTAICKGVYAVSTHMGPCGYHAEWFDDLCSSEEKLADHGEDLYYYSTR